MMARPEDLKVGFSFIQTFMISTIWQPGPASTLSVSFDAIPHTESTGLEPNETSPAKLRAVTRPRAIGLICTCLLRNRSGHRFIDCQPGSFAC